MRKSFKDGVQFAWDSTSLKAFETCPRYYKLKILDRWGPTRTSVHLLFGGWYASALETYHQLRAEGIDYEEATIEVVRKALVDTWIDDAPWQSDHNTKTRENLIRTIVWYLDQFQDDPCKTVTLSNGKAAVEHSFRIEADNDIIFCGHLDRLVEYSDDIYVQDQKTTGSTITARFFNQFNPDTQMSMYTFAGKMIFDAPVKGVMIDGAQIAVGFTRFERGFTFRDEAQLNEWYDSTMQIIERAQEATRNNEFPMHTPSCSHYGGCEFRDICNKSPVVRDNFLRGDFEQGEGWDPLKVR